MGEEKSMDAQALDDPKPPFSLRDTITRSREFFDRMIETTKINSPFAEDKIERVDGAVEGIIHSGYQGFKKIVVNGHPAVILTAAAIVGAGPSLPFGPRAVVRNAGLTIALASMMIYPDHLAQYIPSPSAEKK